MNEAKQPKKQQFIQNILVGFIFIVSCQLAIHSFIHSFIHVVCILLLLDNSLLRIKPIT